MGSVAFTTSYERITCSVVNFFNQKYVIDPSCLQFLEQENTRIELDMKDMLNELNHQKDQNDFLSEKVAQLEVNLKYSKVFSFL